MKTLFRRALVVAALVAVTAGAHAQAPQGIALATYEGADRTSKLVEGARKEGDVLIYTSAPLDDIKPLTDAFERKYGIKVKLWRSSAERVLQRGLAEARANRFEADVFETGGAELDTLVQEKVLTPVRSPVLDELIPQGKLGGSQWAAARLNVYALAYNTRAVHKSDLPRGYEALLDPRWKGKLGVEADDADWFSAVCEQLGERRALKLFREIVTRNGVAVRKGHALLAALVASGEVPLALTVYNDQAERLRSKGAPIDWFVIPPAIARANGVGVAARAPHPHAALLWFDFELSQEGQKLLFEQGFVPTNRAIDTRLNKLPLRFIATRAVVDDGAKWDKLYADIFGAHAAK